MAAPSLLQRVRNAFSPQPTPMAAAQELPAAPVNVGTSTQMGRLEPVDAEDIARSINELPGAEARLKVLELLDTHYANDIYPATTYAVLTQLSPGTFSALKDDIDSIAESAAQEYWGSPVLSAIVRKGGYDPLAAKPDGTGSLVDRMTQRLAVLDAQADDASMTPNFFTSQTDTIRSSIRSAFNHKIILGDVAPQVLADGTPSIAMPVLAKLKLMGVYPDLFKEARVKDDFRKCLRAAYEQIPGHVPHNGQLLFAMRAAGTGFLASSSKWPEFDGGTLDLRPIQAFTESIRQSPKKPPTIAGERAIGTMLAYAATDILMVHGSFDGEYTALSPNDRRELASSFASAAGQLGPGTADAFARTMSVVLADRARRMFQELDFTLQDAIQAWSRQPALAANLKAASCDPETGTWSLKNLSECDPATTQVARKSPNGTWVVQGDNLAHGADHVVISKDGTNIFRDPAGRNIAVARANEPARLMPGREPQMSPSENMLETMGLLRAGWAR